MGRTGAAMALISAEHFAGAVHVMASRYRPGRE